MSPPLSGSPTHPAAAARPRAHSRTFSESERDLAAAHAQAQQGGPPGDPSEGEGEISANELRAEMETLFSLRRRSLSQPTTGVDPDLPPPTVANPPTTTRPALSIVVPSSSSSSSSSSSASLEPPNNPATSPTSPTTPSPAETGTLVRRRSSVSHPLRPSDHPLPPPTPSPPPSPFTQDGIAAAHSSQDLFWLPASLHPELAPKEFKAFIREQTRPDALARRSSLGSGGAVGGGGRVERKKSMLRGEYKPRTDDGVGEGGEVERRLSGGARRGSGVRLNFEQLTIVDLQRLEELAARADSEGAFEEEGEGERLGRVLRRSLSLNPNLVAAAAAVGAHLPPLTLHDALSSSQASASAASPTSPFGDADHDHSTPDSPLIVPPPGQILRRSARTKIRKAGLAGDGGGHRFGPSRRERAVSGSSSAAGDGVVEEDGKTVSPVESAESLDLATGLAPEIEHLETAPAPPPVQDATPVSRLDAALPLLPAATPSAIPLSPSIPPPTTTTVVPASSPEFDWATHHQPPPALAPTPSYVPLTPATPIAPVPFTPAPISPPARPRSPVLQHAATTTRAPASPKDGKEKKSGWARLAFGSSSSSSSSKAAAAEEERKKGKGKEREAAERERERAAAEEREKEKEREKEPGFFGGLFGGGKKKGELGERDGAASGGAAGGAQSFVQLVPAASPEQMRPPPPPTASGALLPNGRYTNFYRLPIHVERAVYRLSHIKLANPRRPLYEQVLISNLMFWYLSIINKPVNPIPPAAPVPVPGHRPNPNPAFSGANDRDENAAGRGYDGGSSPTKDQPPPSSQPPQKRPGLLKQPPADGRRQPGRTAETPVRQTQYDQQTRAIDLEHQHQQYQQQPIQPPPPPSPPLRSPPASPETVSIVTDPFAGVAVAEEPRGPMNAQHRNSFPPRPIPIAYPKYDTGFEVTSRTTPVASTYRDSSAREVNTPPTAAVDRRRRASSSAAERGSIDAADIIDAYGDGSSGSSSPSSSPSTSPILQLDIWKEKPGAKPPLLGTVSPRRRGESLNARLSDVPTSTATSGGAVYHTLSDAVELAPTYSSAPGSPGLELKLGKATVANGRQALGRRPQQ